MTLAAAAIEYAERGWWVLPLRPGQKVPATKNGLKDATIVVDVVRRWWKRTPDLNIGLRTGIHFDVLDLDGDTALDALDRAAPTGARTIVGPIVLTGRGVHIYTRPTGRGNAAGIVARVDWRGRRGYVVAPPSVHPDGHRYLWDFEYGPDTPLEPAPAWLLEAWDRRHQRPPERPQNVAYGAGTTPYGRRALEAELGRLALTAEGCRNDELVRASFRLAQLVAGGELDAREAAEALLAVALRVGLGHDEAVATIRSGMQAGATRPRTAPPRAAR